MPDIFVSSLKKEMPKKKMEIKKTAAEVTLPKKLEIAFKAFSASPAGVYFETQRTDEKIVLLLRRHWVTNFHWLFLSLVFMLAPTVIFPALSFFKVFSFIPVRFQTISLLIFYTLIFTYIFISYLNWYFNVYILTDRRVIDIDFYNLLYKEVSSCDIDKIQDVTYQVSGVFKIFFDYGTVFIQTAGEEKNLEFEMIPRPALVVKKLTELIENYKKWI